MTDDHPVAIKVSGDTEMKQICLELLIQKSVKHPHVVSVESSYLWNHNIYVAGGRTSER